MIGLMQARAMISLTGALVMIDMQAEQVPIALVAVRAMTFFTVRKLTVPMMARWTRYRAVRAMIKSTLARTISQWVRQDQTRLYFSHPCQRALVTDFDASEDVIVIQHQSDTPPTIDTQIIASDMVILELTDGSAIELEGLTEAIDTFLISFVDTRVP